MNLFEQKEETPIFQTGIDESSRAYLLEAARWAKFIAITGFIIFGLWFLVIFAMALTNGSDLTQQMGTSFAAYSLIMTITFVIGGSIFFYINYMMLKFANNTRKGLTTLNQAGIATGFKNLKNMFKAWGIITIILLLIYGVIIIVAIAGIAMRS